MAQRRHLRDLLLIMLLQIKSLENHIIPGKLSVGLSHGGGIVQGSGNGGHPSGTAGIVVPADDDSV